VRQLPLPGTSLPAKDVTRPLTPRRVRLRQLHGDREPPHCQGMMNFTDLPSVPSHPLAPFTDRLRLAVAAYLARFKGTSRTRTESDLRCYLVWCAERSLDPLAAQRPHLELYIRAHPHMLRHTYVTTMLDAGADLRDVQIAARHADPRTTMRV
jgi:integrase